MGLKTRKVKLPNGEEQTEYLPETQADIEKLRKMDEGGKLDTRDSLADQ
jgi:hypothetical protein